MSSIDQNGLLTWCLMESGQGTFGFNSGHLGCCPQMEPPVATNEEPQRGFRAPLAKFDTIESVLLRSSSSESTNSGDDVKSVISVQPTNHEKRDSAATLEAEASSPQSLSADLNSNERTPTPTTPGSTGSAASGSKHGGGISKLFSKFVQPVAHNLSATFHSVTSKVHRGHHGKGKKSSIPSDASPELSHKSSASRGNTSTSVAPVHKNQTVVHVDPSLKKPKTKTELVKGKPAKSKNNTHATIAKVGTKVSGKAKAENKTEIVAKKDEVSLEAFDSEVKDVSSIRSSSTSESSAGTIKGSTHADHPSVDDDDAEVDQHGLLRQDSFDNEEVGVFDPIPQSAKKSSSLITKPDRSKYEIDVKPVERPRSTTPLQLVPLDEYMSLTNDLSNLKPEDKLSIVLPGEEFTPKPRSPRKSLDNQAWFDFCEQGLASPRLRSLSGPVPGIQKLQTNEASSSSAEIPKLPKTLPPAKTFRKRAASSPSSSSSSSAAASPQKLPTSIVTENNYIDSQDELFDHVKQHNSDSWVASFENISSSQPVECGIIPSVEVTSPQSSSRSSSRSSSYRSSSRSQSPDAEIPDTKVQVKYKMVLA